MPQVKFAVVPATSKTRARDLTGGVFGRLTVLSRAGTRGNHALWNCRCSCGAETVVQASHLNSGRIKSCGCYNRDRSTSHGRRRTRAYKIWDGMIQRCTNPSATGYEYYGGRGIQVCEAWLIFEAFHADMGDPPSNDHSLDRRDNDGPYSPDNCRWATKVEQHNNRSDNHLLTYNGQSMTVAEWVRQTGLSKDTILKRLKRGWSVDRTLGTPVIETGRRLSDGFSAS